MKTKEIREIIGNIKGCPYRSCSLPEITKLGTKQDMIIIFPRIMAHRPGDILVMLLNVSYHKEHNYIWFRGGDLNVFRDNK